MAKKIITNYNPFNTDEAHFVFDRKNEWVYYTYYDTGSDTLDLIGKTDIFNNTLYFFIVGPGNHGDKGGEIADDPNSTVAFGKGGYGTNVNGSTYEETGTKIIKSKLAGTNFNIKITLGKLDKFDDMNKNNHVNTSTNVTLNYTDTNGYGASFNYTADANPQNRLETNFSNYVQIPDTPFIFYDGLSNKTIDSNGLITNPYGKYIGGDGGPGPNSSLDGEPVSGSNGGGGGGGARSTGSSYNHYGGNGINGYSGQDRKESYQRKGGDGGDAKNFLQGGVGGGGGGGGLGAPPTNFPTYLNKGEPGSGGTGGLGAIMIYYKKKIPVEFIYSFDTALILNFDPKNILLPIINAKSSFLNVTYNCVMSGSIATVTFNFTHSELFDSDGFSFYKFNSYYANRNVNIIQFDGIPFSKTGSHFKGLNTLTITAKDTPNILPNTSLEYSFSGCKNFNSNINNWDVSNVTNMSYMFQNASSFNQNISAWNVSNVINMSYMFQNAGSFNQNISAWNVSNVTDMSYMFQNATVFNNLNNQMLWNCNNALIATNFGTGSALYKLTIYNPAVRIDNKTSIETYSGTPSTRTLVQLFIYSFVNTGLETFDITKIPIINNSNSFVSFTSSNVIWNILGNITKVFINFTYTNLTNDDGLSFQTNMVKNYYKNNNITIIQFGNIPLSNNISRDPNKFAFNPTIPYVFQDLSGVNLINDAIDLPIILNPTISGKQIMYREFINPGVNNVNITTSTSYKKIIIHTIGAGGSGGAGGGDKKGYKGTDGAGGGGGGYVYQEIQATSFFSYSKIFINVGEGGASVSGGDASTGDSNNGMSGKAGGNTYVNLVGYASLTAYGGSGGGGGHPSSTATAGKGGNGTTMSGSQSNGKIGGNSGYENYTSSKPLRDVTYGRGGHGTSGTYNPNNTPTGSGQNGYVRIYFWN